MTGGNPTVGQSVDDIGILSCVQTFGYLLLFAAIGVVILTFTTILICIYVPNDTSSLVRKLFVLCVLCYVQYEYLRKHNQI